MTLGATRTSDGSAGARLPGPVVLEPPLKTSTATSAATIAAKIRIGARRRRMALTYWEASSGTSWTICEGLKLEGYSVVILPLALIP